MTKPDLGLHLLVKNGASVVGRLLDCVGPYVREAIVVLNDCDDGTDMVLKSVCDRHGVDLKTVEVTAQECPGLYFYDSPAAYEVGPSLCGEKLDVPCTYRHLLGDWAAARNVGWGLGTTGWRLMLDADDVVSDPECLPMLISDLDGIGAEVAASEYVHSSVGGVPATTCLRERLARVVLSPDACGISHDRIRWEGLVHEKLVGYDPQKVCCVRDQLRVLDMRDSTGTGTRIPGRNLKVLYRAARLSDWNITPRHAALLANEAKFFMPSLTIALAEKYLLRSFTDGVTTDNTTFKDVRIWWPEEAAWVACQAGEVYEAEGCHAAAVAWYEQALEHYASASAAFRLARAQFHLGNHLGAVSAYRRGASCYVPQNIDGSSVLKAAVRCLVVGSLANLGRFREARDLCAEALAATPGDAALTTMLAELTPLAGGR